MQGSEKGTIKIRDQNQCEVVVEIHGSALSHPVMCARRGQLEELTLKSNATTELKILFEEPWILQTSHARLRGDVPSDREAGSLSVLAGEWAGASLHVQAALQP